MGFGIDKETLFDNVQKIVLENKLQTPSSMVVQPKIGFMAFIKRHPELSQKNGEYINRARGSVTELAIRKWFDEVIATLGEDAIVLNDPTRIYNMDESGFVLSPKSTLVISERGRTLYNESSRSNKESVTTLFTVNAVGEFAPPLTVFKYARLPKSIVDKAPPIWSLGKTESGWMTAEAFFSYIANVFYPYLVQNEVTFPVVVFLDGHSSHLSEFCSNTGIILISLFPNSTHILQPLDVSVFGVLSILREFKRLIQTNSCTAIYSQKM